jgi:hypothetical protein
MANLARNMRRDREAALHGRRSIALFENRIEFERLASINPAVTSFLYARQR